MTVGCARRSGVTTTTPNIQGGEYDAGGLPRAIISVNSLMLHKAVPGIMRQPAAETVLACEPQVRIGSSAQPVPAAAAAELQRQIGHEQAGLALAFVSSRYDRDALARDLRREFGALPLIGCTTAGEIGPLGYMDGGLSGLTFGRDDLIYEVGLIEGVSRLDNRRGQAFAYGLRQRLAQRVEPFDPNRCFALLLIDGLCGHEEPVARAIHDGLGGIAMAGGSAGDGLDFRQTTVLYDGRFHTDAAVLLVAATPHPFTTFKTQHFVCGAQRMVLSGAIPEQRIATEINGFPAAREYARAIGLELSQLDPMVFSAHPMVVKVGGAEFVRSIQKVNPDGSLTFFCAIDEGIVFNVAQGVDLVDNLNSLFGDIEQRIGPPRLVIGCDCILRRLELVQNGAIDKVSAILRQHHVVGFSTYGEQFRGMHVNQTFTGIAIGARRAAA